METNIINKKRLAGHWVSQRHLHLKRTHIYILTSPFIAPLTVINIFPYTLEQLTVTSQSISSAFRFRTLLFCLILLWHFYICAYRTFNINIFFLKWYVHSEVFLLTPLFTSQIGWEILFFMVVVYFLSIALKKN